MHLLTFLKMKKPGPFMRLMVLGAQGIWCNAMFFAYLISPRTVHRFVGYLEEEAVYTYTRQIEDLDAGRLPKWEKLEAPDIAVEYWKMPVGNRTMRDLLLYSKPTLSNGCAYPLTFTDTYFSSCRREQASGGEPHARQPRSERRPQPLHKRVQGHNEAPPEQRSCLLKAYRLGAARDHLSDHQNAVLTKVFAQSPLGAPFSSPLSKFILRRWSIFCQSGRYQVSNRDRFSGEGAGLYITVDLYFMI